MTDVFDIDIIMVMGMTDIDDKIVDRAINVWYLSIHSFSLALVLIVNSRWVTGIVP